jgi:hypothetical protein
MKKIISLLLSVMIPWGIQAQLPDPLYVDNDQTVYLVFESPVTFIDMGSTDYTNLVEGEIVLLRCVEPNPKPTSLFIKTANNIYVTHIDFKADPEKISYDLRFPSETQSSVSGPGPKYKEKDTQTYATVSTDKVAAPVSKDAQERELSLSESELPTIIQNRILVENRVSNVQNPDDRQKVWKLLQNEGVSVSEGYTANKLSILLTSCYVDDKYIYLRFLLKNKSSIGFKIDFFSFYLEESKKMKRRSASQGQNLIVRLEETVKEVGPKMTEEMVYAIDLYALENSDKLSVRINELDGERTLNFDIPGRVITNAKRF